MAIIKMLRVRVDYTLAGTTERVTAEGFLMPPSKGRPEYIRLYRAKIGTETVNIRWIPVQMIRHIDELGIEETER